MILKTPQAGELNEMLRCLKSGRDLHSTDSLPQRLNRPVVVQRGNMSVGLGGDTFPPRSIKITLPPFRSSGLAVDMRLERKNRESDGWSDSTPFEETLADVEEPEEKQDMRIKVVKLLHGESASLESSRKNSEYYSCPSHLSGSDGG